MNRPIFHPETLPVESTDAALPPMPAGRLTPGALRERFARTLEWIPEPPEQRLRRFVGDPRQAAVLVPLVTRATGVTVLLTQRTAHLSMHAGQVSFPGGSRDPNDTDVVATALREAFEEIALDPARVEVLGRLPDYLTSTGFLVAPVVGFVHEPFAVTPHEYEVAEIFEVPLAFLMNPAHHETRVFRWQESGQGGERRFFAMPYPRADQRGCHFIWGATAGMLRNLYRFLIA